MRREQVTDARQTRQRDEADEGNWNAVNIRHPGHVIRQEGVCGIRFRTRHCVCPCRSGWIESERNCSEFELTQLDTP